jgi:hypothetical protein
MRSKIFITGFLHSGTSILRAKISDCDNVFSQIMESQTPKGDSYEEYLSSGKEFFLWKDPIIRNSLYNTGFPKKDGSPFQDCHIIFLVRNPFYVFSSLQRRSKGIVNHDFHRFEDWEKSAFKFLEIREKKYEDTYTIKYEEFFDEGFQNLKKIFDQVGLIYPEDIFETKKKDYYHDFLREVPQTPEKTLTKNSHHRTWQINQNFQNFNLNSKVELTPELYERICSSSVLPLLGYQILENNPI